MAGVAVLLAAALLLFAGVAKLRSGDRGIAALDNRLIPRALRTRTAATLAAAAEVATSIGVLAWNHTTTQLVLAAWYITFTVMIALGIAAKAEDCGCLGSTPSRPAVSHLLITATFALASLTLAASSSASSTALDITTAFQHDALMAGGLVLALASGAALLIALLGPHTETAQLLRQRQRPRPRPRPRTRTATTHHAATGAVR